MHRKQKDNKSYGHTPAYRKGQTQTGRHGRSHLKSDTDRYAQSRTDTQRQTRTVTGPLGNYLRSEEKSVKSQGGRMPFFQRLRWLAAAAAASVRDRAFISKSNFFYSQCQWVDSVPDVRALSSSLIFLLLASYLTISRYSSAKQCSL